jgi:hypothetical protein
MSGPTVAVPLGADDSQQGEVPPSGDRSPLLSVRLANLAILLWLAGVLLFGRAFSEIGHEPIFLADALAAVGALLSLPRWWPTAIKPGTRGLLVIAGTIAVLNVQSVYRGVEAGYPAALKSACMGVYPLVAVAIAGLVARDPDLVRRFAQHILPLVPIGFLLIAFAGVPYIAASSGLYLAFAAAWATAPGNVRRGVVGVSTLIAVSYLAEDGARRGPTLAIVLAIVTTWVASWRRLRVQPRRQSETILAMAACFFVALIAGTALVMLNGGQRTTASDLPVVGSLVSRVATSSQPGTESGNNVALRWEMWRYALITTAEEHPLIGRGAGKPVETGLGSTIIIDRKSGVHNSFVGYVFYSGFPSAILVMLAFLLAIMGSWSNRSLPGHASLLGATVAAVATSMTNVALETPYIAGPAWAVVGASVGAAAAAKAKFNNKDIPSSVVA